MVPYLRFVGYIYWKGVNPSSFLNEGLPVPTEEDVKKIWDKFEPYKKKGLKAIGLDKKFIKKITNLYPIWNDPRLYSLVLAGVIRDWDNVPELLYKVARIKISQNDLDFFIHSFCDIELVTDLIAFKDSLGGEYYSYISRILEDIPDQILLQEFGVYDTTINLKNTLERMFVKAAYKFESEQDIKWGKFALSLAKELKDQDTGDEDLIKKLEIVLETPPLFHTLDEE